MKTNKQIKLVSILILIIFILIYGTQLIYKLENEYLALLIVAGISGGIGLYNTIIRGNSSKNIDTVKDGILDIKDGVLNVKEDVVNIKSDLIDIKEENIKMKEEVQEVKKKVTNVAFMVTEKELQDAEQFEFLTNGFLQLENKIKKIS